MKRSVALAIGAGVVLAAGVTGWGLYCLYNTRPFSPFDGLLSTVAGAVNPPSIVNGRYSQEILDTWRRSPREIALVSEGARIPADARPARLVLPRSTAPFARNADTGSREVRRAMYRFLRDALRAAGRGDEDVRVVMLRVAIESGWLRAGRSFHNNLGNIKAQGHVWATDWPTAMRGELSTDIGDARLVYILRDRVRSVDGYPGFESLSDYLRFDNRVITRRYPLAKAGAIQGGEAGLVRAEEALGRGGYSPAGPTERRIMAWAYWRRSRAMFGDVWEDRAAFERYLDGANMALQRAN